MSCRTRIVATLGPATDRAGVLENLFRAGVNVARINFSHGTPDEQLARMARVRELAAGLDRPVAILGDLPGPKLRVLLDQPRTLTAGEELTIASRPAGGVVGITEPTVLATLQPGQRVLFDDGRLPARVLRAEAASAALRVEVGGILAPNKGINLPDTALTLPALTERDVAALRTAAAGGVDWLALSFVRAASAADEVREAARAAGLDVPV